MILLQFLLTKRGFAKNIFYPNKQIIFTKIFAVFKLSDSSKLSILLIFMYLKFDMFLTHLNAGKKSSDPKNSFARKII